MRITSLTSQMGTRSVKRDMTRYAAVVKHKTDLSWSWMGIAAGEDEKDAMAGVAISALGYDESRLSVDDIIFQFWEDGWRARLYELKEYEDRDEFQIKLDDLI